MIVHKTAVCAAGCAMFFALILFGNAQTTTTQQITLSGATSMQPAPQGTDAVQDPEVDTSMTEADLGSADSGGGMVNRSIAVGPGPAVSALSGKKAKSNPQLNVSFNGLNFRQQRLANNGNQFSVEPPDQGGVRGKRICHGVDQRCPTCF